MKRGFWILLAALFAGIVGFVMTHRPCCAVVAGHTPTAQGGSHLPELEWLRTEFALTDEQFANVSRLHLAYRPTCEALCAKVMTSQERLERLLNDGRQVSPELQSALQEHAALHVECQTAMLAHVYGTAACLQPDQARRYLEMVIPHLMEMPMEPGSAPAGH